MTDDLVSTFSAPLFREVCFARLFIYLKSQYVLLQHIYMYGLGSHALEDSIQGSKLFLPTGWQVVSP